MAQEATNTIRMYGCLHTIRKDRGLPNTQEISIPPEGRKAEDIARDLDLPLDMIEGIFVNHVCFNLDKVVFPGDKLAFVPTGVPGPHRYTLGIYSSSKHEDH